MQEKPIFECVLPFPPSVNHMWRNFGGRRTIKAKKYREWEILADKCRRDLPVPILSDIRAEYVYGRPDRRKRDLDNLSKGISDTLMRWSVIKDDSQIVDLRLRWGEVEAGTVLVRLYTATGDVV